MQCPPSRTSHICLYNIINSVTGSLSEVQIPEYQRPSLNRILNELSPKTYFTKMHFNIML